jgi:hypothetical protein
MINSQVMKGHAPHHHPDMPFHAVLSNGEPWLNIATFIAKQLVQDCMSAR